MTPALIILAIVSALIAFVAYAACVVGGRADDASERRHGGGR